MPSRSRLVLVWFARLVEGALVVGACAATVRFLGARTPIDDGLAWLAIIVVVASWVVPDESSPIALLGAPLLIANAVAVKDEPVRLFGYGVIVVAVVAFAAASLILSRRLSRSRAVVLATLAVAATVVGVSGGQMITAAIVLGGTAVLGFVVFHDGYRNAVPLALVAAVGVATPLVPWRASLVPLVIAAAVVVFRNSSWRNVVIAAVVGVVAGKWGLVMVLVPAAFSYLARRYGLDDRAAPLAAPSPSRGALAGIVRVFAVDPGAAVEMWAGGVALVGSVGGLAVVGSFLRPALAMRFALAALVLISAAVPSREDNARATVPVAFLAIALAMLAWSGVTAAVFPLPLGVVPVVAVALIASTALAGRYSVFAGLVAGALFLAGVVMLPSMVLKGSPVRGPRGTLLGAGDVLVARSSTGGGAVSLVAAGVDTAGLGPKEILGWMEILGGDGTGYRRAIRAAEVADWAALRAPVAFTSNNGIPRDPVGGVEGTGRGAFIRGSGLVTIRIGEPIVGVRIIGAKSLGSKGRIEVESVTFGE